MTRTEPMSWRLGTEPALRFEPAETAHQLGELGKQVPGVVGAGAGLGVVLH